MTTHGAAMNYLSPSRKIPRHPRVKRNTFHKFRRRTGGAVVAALRTGGEHERSRSAHSGAGFDGNRPRGTCGGRESRLERRTGSRPGTIAAGANALRIRTIPDRLAGKTTPLRLRLNDLVSTPAEPGFQVLVEDAPHELAAGAIGKVWRPVIPFVHVADAAAYAAFSETGYIKVAWALRVVPEGTETSRVEFELRVAATDEDALRKFKRYFRLIGPASRFIRHLLLAQLERDLGTPDGVQNERALPGRRVDCGCGRTVYALNRYRRTGRKIWPWLVQMGCQRAGFYSLDLLDNAGVPSAREIRLDLQQLRVGDKISATPKDEEHFEVLRLEQNRALVLGGLFDTERRQQIAFTAPRPPRYWHVSWAFVLEPLDRGQTRLYARARAAFSASERFHAFWIGPVHHLMQTAQLRHLAARAEGRLPRDSTRDMLAGVGGATVATLALLTPFLRERRSHWGLDSKMAAREYPGDHLIAEPRWSWTHGVEIEASPERRLAVDRSVRCRSRRLLQLPIPREHRRLRASQRGLDSSGMGAAAGRRVGFAPARPALAGRCCRTGSVSPRRGRCRSSGACRRGGLGNFELADFSRSARSNALPADQPVPMRVLRRRRDALCVRSGVGRTRRVCHGPPDAARHQTTRRAARHGSSQ